MEQSWSFAGEESWQSSGGVRERAWDSHATRHQQEMFLVHKYHGRAAQSIFSWQSLPTHISSTFGPGSYGLEDDSEPHKLRFGSLVSGEAGCRGWLCLLIRKKNWLEATQLKTPFGWAQPKTSRAFHVGSAKRNSSLKLHISVQKETSNQCSVFL